MFAKYIIKLEQIILRISSYLVPVKLLKRVIVATDNYGLSRILTTREIRHISEEKLDMIPQRVMTFKESYNTFHVFNMCYLSDLLGKALFAVAWGCIPDFQVPDVEGENYFKTFFEENQWCEQTVHFEHLRLPKCMKYTPYPHWFMSVKERESYHLLYKKFFHIKEEILNAFNEEYDAIRKNIPENSRLIGCVARGTDYIIKKPTGHPVQPETEQLIEIIKKNITERDSIFLATEEKKIFDTFVKIFGKSRVITTDSLYYDGLYESENINIAEYKFDRKNDKYMRGYEYFRRVYILSKCDGMISPVSGATKISLIMKEGRYLPEIIINLGEY